MQPSDMSSAGEDRNLPTALTAGTAQVSALIMLIRLSDVHSQWHIVHSQWHGDNDTVG